IADQLDESQDSLILEGFDITDLNQDTINSFRNRLRAIKPNHPWVALDDKQFLYKLGAYDKNRKLGIEGITAAGLLMFGEDRAITDEFPKYFLDYREKMSQEVRWDYRVISSDGTWSGNIFDFYFKIINRITDNLNIPFRIVNGVRQEETRVHEAVREAVANALIHADYRLPRGIVIEKRKTFFKIINPGSLRITRDEALKGGVSDPRNENIFKMFNILGVGERAGSGLENIQLAWKEQEWLAPDLEELYNPDRISLTLRTVSMLPEESIGLLKSALKGKYNELIREEVMALVAAHQEEYITNNRLQQLLDTHALVGNKILSTLVDKGYLEADGIGRGTKYFLTNIFKWTDQEYRDDVKINDEIEDSKDEKLIINYINKNQFITNSLARSELNFSKTTASRVFNRLINKKKIIRIGSGTKIKYIIYGNKQSGTVEG
ncbi:MAG: ATP-binding protein, partial [Clostridium sp.]